MKAKRFKVAILLIIGVISVTGCKEIDMPADKMDISNNDKKMAHEHFLKAEELIERSSATDEAIEEYKKAIELDPTNPKFYEELGSAYIVKYNDLRDKEGGRDYQYYDPADSEAIRLYGLGIENMKKALSIDPDYYWAHEGLARAYLDMGRYDEAEKECQAILDNEESIMYARNVAHGLLSSIYKAQGKKEEAEKEGNIARALHRSFENITFTESVSGYYLQKGDEYLIKDKFDEAIKEYQKALESEPDNALAYAKLGGGYLAKAEPYLEKIQKRAKRGKDVESSPEMKKARELQQEGKKYLDKAISLDPGEPYTHLFMGIYYSGKGQYDKAVEEYNFVLGSERAAMVLKYYAHNGLKEIYENLGKTEESQKEEEWLKEFKKKRKEYGEKVLMW